MSEQLIQAIAHRDNQTLARLASKYRPAQERNAKGVVNTEAERLVDSLFRQLKQVFPASAATNLRTDTDEAVAKQQWILAFAENGITKREQLVAGMKRARASLSPFWPSPGQFIEWCREGEYKELELPTNDELIAMVHAYCAHRGFYDSPEAYPWKHPSHYWLVTSLYSKMISYYLTAHELRLQAAKELAKMTHRIKSGEDIPGPRILLKNHKVKPISREDALNKIKALRKKYGWRDVQK
ncbi:replication protein P [Cronobacter dublinensis]|uniref:replication protein P n=1 Tax=Cronobacter dublinensis TaxID=413497 RepID=UPI000CFB8FEB|nr:replication protein P [Cronobacter dublinensis]EKF2277829.1 DNA replication protein [Cronobacter dublinensis]EKF2291601.1 DNA replication protein [Cronobacter dublinensis]EKF2297233.1 DNA replication protein [Cronobacter dublinensis]EKK5269349.1 DNA replication protein [Cronobacter dublinensis]EKM0137852.1 DNA replication protein [Cronobacter dublinensis]